MPKERNDARRARRRAYQVRVAQPTPGHHRASRTTCSLRGWRSAVNTLDVKAVPPPRQRHRGRGGVSSPSDHLPASERPAYGPAAGECEQPPCSRSPAVPTSLAARPSLSRRCPSSDEPAVSSLATRVPRSTANRPATAASLPTTCKSETEHRVRLLLPIGLAELKGEGQLLSKSALADRARFALWAGDRRAATSRCFRGISAAERRKRFRATWQ
jgi:hypothetical protein